MFKKIRQKYYMHSIQIISLLPTIKSYSSSWRMKLRRSEISSSNENCSTKAGSNAIPVVKKNVLNPIVRGLDNVTVVDAILA